ncbi:hypothetical protein U1Q18_013703 [Sarracenia purpurea var. burkii]
MANFRIAVYARPLSYLTNSTPQRDVTTPRTASPLHAAHCTRFAERRRLMNAIDLCMQSHPAHSVGPARRPSCAIRPAPSTYERRFRCMPFTVAHRSSPLLISSISLPLHVVPCRALPLHSIVLPISKVQGSVHRFAETLQNIYVDHDQQQLLIVSDLHLSSEQAFISFLLHSLFYPLPSLEQPYPNLFSPPIQDPAHPFNSNQFLAPNFRLALFGPIAVVITHTLNSPY